jgi:hypothetical protein
MPTPRQIDEIVEHFEQIRDEAELADERYIECKDALIALVKRFGIVPPGAESSVRIQGILTSVTVTTGTTIAIKEDAVGELKGAMEANERSDLFALLFSTRTKYELQKDAATQLRIANIPQRLVKKFTELYARCFDVKKKAPSLKVERLADKPAKKSRAKKETI